MNREELEQVIYERTRNFVDGRVMDCIFELIAEEREACAAIAEMPKYLNETGILTVNPAKSAAAHFIAIAIRARGEENKS